MRPMPHRLRQRRQPPKELVGQLQRARYPTKVRYILLSLFLHNHIFFFFANFDLQLAVQPPQATNNRRHHDDEDRHEHFARLRKELKIARKNDPAAKPHPDLGLRIWCDDQVEQAKRTKNRLFPGEVKPDFPWTGNGSWSQ